MTKRVLIGSRQLAWFDGCENSSRTSLVKLWFQKLKQIQGATTATAMITITDSDSQRYGHEIFKKNSRFLDEDDKIGKRRKDQSDSDLTLEDGKIDKRRRMKRLEKLKN